MITWTNEQRYVSTLNMIKLLIGDVRPDCGCLESFTKFGYHGYDITIFKDHIDFFEDLIQVLGGRYPSVIDISQLNSSEIKPFGGEAIRRWILLNDLIICRFRGSKDISSVLKHEMPNLACLVGFPLLEDVARFLSKAWDEDGILLTDIPISLGLYTVDSNGNAREKYYRKGQRIISFVHKLFIMKNVLPPTPQRTLDNLDKRLQKPFIGTEKMSPLFDRLGFHRNLWSHGRSFDGWEGILVSLLMCLIYFGLQLNQNTET